MKLTSGLIKYMNIYTGQIKWYILLLHIKTKQFIPITGKDHNLWDNFRPHKNENPDSEGVDREEDNINLISKRSDIENRIRYILLKRIL